jgi:hemoglobin-like flavoprotein
MNVVLLRESFDLVAPRKEAFAAAFYDRLFSQFPATKSFFAQTDMKKQQAALVGALALVVSGVEKGEDLTGVLKSLGTRHESYGVLPEHYPIVGQVLIETFQAFLGPDWTPAYEETWVTAYGVVTQSMLN